jgi:putative transposase
LFYVDDDWYIDFEMLKKESNIHGLEIHAYCLLTNHIHLVAVPNKAGSLAMTLGRAPEARNLLTC